MAYTDIDKSSDYFNTKLYSGNSSTQAITGVGFQPDLIWIKSRTGAVDHDWVDSVRGVNKAIASNTTSTEGSFGSNYTIDSFDSDGFTLHNALYNNASGSNYTSWNWLAGGTASSNTDGSITSSVSVNTTAGFSIVSWTGNATLGATVGHGLGSAPKFMIIKNRSSALNWIVYHHATLENRYMELNTSNAEAINFDYWDSTRPGSSVFTIGTANTLNGSGNSMIGYCFAEKKGFSKFGSYIGNGSANGTFVYTGFKPAMVILKRIDSAENWDILDNKRNTYNVSDKLLKPNLSNVEGTFSTFDMLSNGFKMRNSDAEFNASGGSYLYSAFAENPFTTSTGIPTTAR